MAAAAGGADDDGGAAGAGRVCSWKSDAEWLNPPTGPRLPTTELLVPPGSGAADSASPSGSRVLGSLRRLPGAAAAARERDCGRAELVALEAAPRGSNELRVFIGAAGAAGDHGEDDDDDDDAAAERAAALLLQADVPRGSGGDSAEPPESDKERVAPWDCSLPVTIPDQAMAVQRYSLSVGGAGDAYAVDLRRSKGSGTMPALAGGYALAGGTFGRVLVMPFAPEGVDASSALAEDWTEALHEQNRSFSIVLKDKDCIVYGTGASPFQPGRAAAGGSNNSGAVLDIEAQTLLSSLDHHEDFIRDVVWSPSDPNMVFLSGDDSLITGWDTRDTARPALKFDDMAAILVLGLDITLDGQLLFCSTGGSSRLYDVRKPEALHVVAKTQGDGAAVSTSGRYVASGLWGGGVHVWDLAPPDSPDPSAAPGTFMASVGCHQRTRDVGQLAFVRGDTQLAVLEDASFAVRLLRVASTSRVKSAGKR